MEFILALALILVGVIGGLTIRWAWTRDPDPVEKLLKRTFVEDGVLHIKGGPLTPEQAHQIRDAWDRQYPFRRRAF